MFLYFELILLVFIFSLFLGRWAYYLVLIYEGHRRQSPYRCWSCNNFLNIWPWPIRKQKCSKCDRRLDIRCIFIEWLLPFLFLGLLIFQGFTWWTLEVSIFCFMAVVACTVDIKRTILPDTFTLGGIAIALLGAFLNPERSFSVAFTGTVVGGGGLLLFSLIYYFLRKREGIGLGDVKMLAWIGALVGLKGVVYVMLTACLLGLFFWCIFLWFYREKGKLRQEMAFGPYLAFSTYVIILLSNIDFFDSYLILE